VSTNTLTCAHCAIEFPQPAARRGGRVQRFCTPKCRVAGANARRSTTRTGRINGPTNPHAGEPSGQPSSPEVITIPPSVDRAAHGSPHTRISELMEKGHSRTGITAWEIAELAKLRGISAWAPLKVILAPAKGL
jgi:hypothetical protein